MLMPQVATVFFAILMTQTKSEETDDGIGSETVQGSEKYEIGKTGSDGIAYGSGKIDRKIDSVPLKVYLKAIQSVSPPSNSIDGIESSTVSYENGERRPYVYATAKTVPTSSGFYVPVHSVVSHVQGPGIISQVQVPRVTSQTDESHEEKPAKYKYGYRVFDPKTGTDFGHSEVNNGEIVTGYYHVLLPDGRLQNVKYWAGDFGYNAIVTYDH